MKGQPLSHIHSLSLSLSLSVPLSLHLSLSLSLHLSLWCVRKGKANTSWVVKPRESQLSLSLSPCLSLCRVLNAHTHTHDILWYIHPFTMIKKPIMTKSCFVQLLIVKYCLWYSFDMSFVQMWMIHHIIKKVVCVCKMELKKTLRGGWCVWKGKHKLSRQPKEYKTSVYLSHSHSVSPSLSVCVSTRIPCLTPTSIAMTNSVACFGETGVDGGFLLICLWQRKKGYESISLSGTDLN